MNRAQRRATARNEQRTARAAVALGSTAVLATAGAGAALVLSSTPAGANATIVVDSLTDDGTGTTLRDAIVAANAAPGQDEITFSVSGTITLASDLPEITDAVHFHGPGADALTIDGTGAFRVFHFHRVYSTDGTDEVTDLTVTGGNGLSNPDGSGGAIDVWYGSADLVVADVVLTDNYATDGGAIELYYTEGEITISGAEITGNTAHHWGGGLYAWGSSADPASLHITITDSVIADNVAEAFGETETGGGGGGVYVGGAVLEVSGSTISRNSTETEFAGGGGIHALYAIVTVTDSTISDNTTDNMGGGLYFYNASGTVIRSTISGNAATGDGGGGVATFGTGAFTLFDSTVSDNTGFYYGGGLYLRGESSTIIQSTISGNSSPQAGGIYVGDYAGAAILLSTVTDNTATGPSNLPAVHGIQVGGGAVAPAERRAHREDRSGVRATHHGRDGGHVRVSDDPIPAGTLQLIGTLVVGNGDLDLGDYNDEAVTVESLGSILGIVEPGAVTVHDHGGTRTGVSTASVALGPLADNGGPTQTHALLPGSAAIDSGPASADIPEVPGLEWDQRGEPYVRIANGTIDVGAYEVQVEPPEPSFTG